MQPLIGGVRLRRKRTKARSITRYILYNYIIVFIDNNLYVLQAEYRWRFMPRWVLAGFVLVGEVADLPRNFFADLKPSLGGGVRFQISKSQQTLLRVDVGFGKDGSGGFYFGVDEAF